MKVTNAMIEHKCLIPFTLDGHEINAGDTVTAIKIDAEFYKVFHHTGWWKVDAYHFEAKK